MDRKMLKANLNQRLIVLCRFIFKLPDSFNNFLEAGLERERERLANIIIKKTEFIANVLAIRLFL